MTTRELIQAEIERMDERQLDHLYALVQLQVTKKPAADQRGILSKLGDVQIDALTDFAAALKAEQRRPAGTRRSLADLVGLLATEKPPPSDEECERILAEES